MWWWEATPRAGLATAFCRADYYGDASGDGAGLVGGVSPAFCVA
jgi:hypothetical protein